MLICDQGPPSLLNWKTGFVPLSTSSVEPLSTGFKDQFPILKESNLGFGGTTPGAPGSPFGPAGPAGPTDPGCPPGP